MANEPEIVMELKEKEKQGLLKTGFQDDFDESDKLNTLLQMEGEEDVFLRSNLLTSLLKNIPDSIYFKDLEGRFIEVSESKAEHLGVEKESILGKTDFDFYSKKEAQRMGNDDLFVMQNKEILQAEEKVRRNEIKEKP